MSMNDKILVVALRSFELNHEIKTRLSKPFAVDRRLYNQLAARNLVGLAAGDGAAGPDDSDAAGSEQDSLTAAALVGQNQPEALAAIQEESRAAVLRAAIDIEADGKARPRVGEALAARLTEVEAA